MNNNEKAIAINPTTPIVEKQSQNQNSNNSIAEQKLTYNCKIVKPLETIDGKTLFEKELSPLKFVINKILPQGLFILAGNPKVGKSWLSLDFCQAVATGGQIWNCLAEKGAVLYLALEDSLTRLQSRLMKYTDEGISELHFATRASKIQDGLIIQVADFIRQHASIISYGT